MNSKYVICRVSDAEEEEPRRNCGKTLQFAVPTQVRENV